MIGQTLRRGGRDALRWRAASRIVSVGAKPGAGLFSPGAIWTSQRIRGVRDVPTSPGLAYDWGWTQDRGTPSLRVSLG
jgi:hypothetical protein